MSAIIKFLKQMIAYALALLPDSPFSGFIDQLSDLPYLGYINYFVPISAMVKILAGWVSAIVLYYAVSAVLRWAGAID